MLNRLNPHAAAFGLAAAVTLVTLGGMGALANSQYNEAVIAQAEEDAPIIQQIEVIGNAVQQVVITGRKRG